MKRHLFALFAGFAGLAAVAEIEICSPGFSPTKVSETGVIAEPWGSVQLKLLAPEGAKAEATKAEQIPMPAAVTRATAGPVSFAQTAYRAPVWPGGVDVLDVAVRNAGKEPTKAVLELTLPEKVSAGERTAIAGGSPVLLLLAGPVPIRNEREWGCLGGVSLLPGWAKPKIECDPAFRNIAAGMGGVPISYRFTVGKGEKRCVVLGFCESHHPAPGNRVMDVKVEGAPVQTVDPNEKWGRHQPGVLQFAASDANQDGRIEIRVAPHPGTPDRNPILNAIWIFKDSTSVNPDALIRGELNEGAEHFVDVGGKGDQALYVDSTLRFEVGLAPGQESALCFLLRNQSGAIPEAANTTWTPEKLRKAAMDVWTAKP